MSLLTFYFQEPFSGWMPTSIFKILFSYYKNIYPDIEYSSEISYNSNYGSVTGPHHLIIKNTITNKYKIATYWDFTQDLFHNSLGWDNKNCLGIYSVVNSNLYNSITPSSYCVYNKVIEDAIDCCDTNFQNKTNESLLFRGYLYADRYALFSITTKNNNAEIKITNELLSSKNYITELNSYKIGLSLNGAAEICNRDMEILGLGCVLLRPRLLATKFFNPLIPNFHYIPFDIVDNPKDQLEIILESYFSLIKDKDLMIYIANNGLDWYKNNGSKNANVNILSQIINIEELL